MLAQNFKSADELKLTEIQHASLIAVLRMLEREEITHLRYSGAEPYGSAPEHFNMLEWRCGSVACIGGWAEHIGKCGFKPGNGDALDVLFYPDSYGIGNLEFITTAQAAMALRSYLTTGNANWRDALKVD